MTDKTTNSPVLHTVVINCLLTSFHNERRARFQPALLSPANSRGNGNSVSGYRLTNPIPEFINEKMFRGGKKKCEGINFPVMNNKEKERGVHHV